MERPGLLGRFLLPLIPVHSARELIAGLSQSWQLCSGAETALVNAAFAGMGRALVGSYRGAEFPEVEESECDLSALVGGLAGLLSIGGTLVPTGKPAAIHEFRAGSRCAGGVLLYSRREICLSEEAIGELCAVSARLIDQADHIERLRASRRILEAEKTEAIAEFAAGAGHEINNPLATIAGRVQLLLRDESDPERCKSLATIGAQASRIRDMIGDLMLFARPPAPARERISLNELAQFVVEGFREKARTRDVTLTICAGEPVPAVADPTQWKVALSELVRNALDAVDVRGTIRIALQRSTVGENPCAIVSVTDNGRGLTEKDRAHAFDPYYSGRNAGRGLGFGLCKCWRIVANHGGRIEVDSIPGVATTFRTYWPDQPQRATTPAD